MDLPLLRKTFALLATYFTLLPIAAALYNYRFLDKNFKLLLIYLLLSFLTDQVSAFYFLIGINNMIYVNTYVLLEPLFLIYLLYQWQLRKPSRNTDVYLVMVALLIFWIYSALVYHDEKGQAGIYSSMKIFSTVYGAVIAVFSSVRLLRLVESGNEIIKNPKFWAITAILIYSTCSLIVISTNSLVPKSAWILFNITNIIYYLILTKAFLTCRK